MAGMTTKPNAQSRAVLLGYLLGHVSSIGPTTKRDGFESIRRTAERGVQTQLDELGLYQGPVGALRRMIRLRHFTLKNVGANALTLSDEIARRHDMKTAMLFNIGLSLAILPIRRQQGLPTRESEHNLETLAEKGDVQELVASLLTKFRNDAPDYNETVAEAITRIAHRTAPKVFIGYSEANSAIAVSIAEYLESKGIATWYYGRDSIAASPHLEQTKAQIDSCMAFVAVLSAADRSSHWIPTEIHTAAGARKPRFPILVDITYEELPSAIQLAFGTNVGVSWATNSPDVRVTLARILRGIEAAAGPN